MDNTVQRSDVDKRGIVRIGSTALSQARSRRQIRSEDCYLDLFTQTQVSKCIHLQLKHDKMRNYELLYQFMFNVVHKQCCAYPETHSNNDVYTFDRSEEDWLKTSSGRGRKASVAPPPRIAPAPQPAVSVQIQCFALHLYRPLLLVNHYDHH